MSTLSVRPLKNWRPLLTPRLLLLLLVFLMLMLMLMLMLRMVLVLVLVVLFPVGLMMRVALVL